MYKNIATPSLRFTKLSAYLRHGPPEYVVIMEVAGETGQVLPHLLHARHLPHLLLCWRLARPVLGQSSCSALSLSLHCQTPSEPAETHRTPFISRSHNITYHYHYYYYYY